MRTVRNGLWVVVSLCLLVAFSVHAAEETLSDVSDSVSDLEKRLMKVERASAMDRVAFKGDFRFEAHSIQAHVPDHFDGLDLQRNIVNTMFYFGQTGAFPSGLDAVDAHIAANYADYLFFTQNLSFEDLKQMMGSMPPAQQQQLMQMLMPSTYAEGEDVDNEILYTSRLRLNMDATVADNVSFSGRLGMYKTWGDSTGVQVFNGQPNSINIDGTTVGVPNSDILRVERAYFTWKDIADVPAYLSIGRRPSTGGAPLHLRQDEARGGTPMGSLINYQFDGATLGYHLTEESTFRLCYGVGYEAGFGNGEPLDSPQNDLKDTQFFGINWDILNTDNTFIQATVARAFDVADGFNGLVVLPKDPVTGQDVGAPIVMRFTPSTNLGDIDLASLVLMRKDGPIDWFASINYMHSDPNNVTTPFGGLFCDPFEVPESEEGYMVYLGARLTLPNDDTKIGFEYNHGTEYWFNFAHAEDDILGAKTGTRGNVYEVYLTHRIAKNFVVKADYIYYDYEYSGSSWHLGAPKDLDDSPILGTQTYDKAQMASLSFSARF